MKTCDRIRSLLLTDYIDGELDKEAAFDVEEHLSECPECSRLVGMISEDISAISDSGARQKLPGYLWQAIVSRIEEKRRVKNILPDIIRGLADRFTMPVLSPALAGIILLALSASFFVYTHQVSSRYGNENFEYIAGLFTNGAASAEALREGLGSPIEEYFL